MLTEENDVNLQGLQSIMGLASVYLDESADLTKAFRGFCRAKGVMEFLEQTVFKNPNYAGFQEEISQGFEMAQVYAKNFKMTLPGTIWVGLQSSEEAIEDARSEVVLISRDDTWMVNLHEVRLTAADGATYTSLGIWDDNGEVVDTADIGKSDFDPGPVIIRPGALAVERHKLVEAGLV